MVLNDANPKYYLWHTFYTQCLTSMETCNAMRDTYSPLQAACVLHLHEALQDYHSRESLRDPIRNDPLLLLAACKSTLPGGSETVEVLLQAGADIAVGDPLYSSSLHAACFLGTKEIVDVLLAAIADVEQLCAIYPAALHAALYLGRRDISGALLIACANMNVLDEKYCLALRTIPRERQEDFIDILLAHYYTQQPATTYFTAALHFSSFDATLRFYLLC
jgi:hypothetical protein